MIADNAPDAITLQPRARFDDRPQCAVNTYVGETVLAPDNGAGSTNTLKMGIANAISASSGVNFTNTVATNTGGLVFDLNGFNQSVAYLASGTAPTPTHTNYTILNNATGTTATLTVSNLAIRRWSPDRATAPSERRRISTSSPTTAPAPAPWPSPRPAPARKHWAELLRTPSPAPRP